jgi:hypothetical protein
MVPVLTASGQLVFRRGILERPEGSGFVGNPAHANVLEPGTTVYLAHRIITRSVPQPGCPTGAGRGVDATTYLGKG